MGRKVNQPEVAVMVAVASVLAGEVASM